MFSLVTVGLFTLVPHFSLERSFATNMISLWRPTVVNGNVLNAAQVDRFTKSRILLEEKGIGGVIVSCSSTPNLYVFSTPDNHTTIVESCLFYNCGYEVEDLRALRDWHDDTFPDRVLTMGSKMDPRDKLAWIDTL